MLAAGAVPAAPGAAARPSPPAAAPLAAAPLASRVASQAAPRLLGPRGEAVPVVNEGGEIELKAVDAAGAPLEASGWSSDSQGVAAVTGSGLLRGLRFGFATVTARTSEGDARAVVAVARVGRRNGERVSGDTKTDSGGNVYLSSPRSHVIYRVRGSTSGVLAGAVNQSGYKNGKGAKARFDTPAGLGVDNRAQGGVFIADTANHAIRKVDPTGAVQAALGGPQSAGQMADDETPFERARLGDVRGVAVAGGDLYFTDAASHAVYHADFGRRVVRLVAGEPGTAGSADGTGRTARFDRPSGIAADGDGSLLAVADSGNGTVRLIRISRGEGGAVLGEVTTLGLASSARGADVAAARALDSAADAVAFDAPHSVSFDGLGNVYVVDARGASVVTRAPGRVDVVALAQEGSLGTPASVTTSGTTALVLDESAAAGEAVVSVSVGPPAIGLVSPQSDRLSGGADVTVDGANFAPETKLTLGDAEVTDYTVESATRIRFRVPPQESPGGRTLTVATRGGAAQTIFAIRATPLSGLAAGEVTTVAGGVAFVGDGGLASHPSVIADPIAVAVAGNGDVYFAEPTNQRVRRIDARTGLITTVAGTGRRGFSGDGGPAVGARLDHPQGVAVDGAGNVYVSDGYNVRVRRVDAVTGIITTVAGDGDVGFRGDNGPATSASLDGPSGLAVDAAGSLYIADSINNRIRKVDPRGVITTVAGSSGRGFAGDNGPATAASLNQPAGIAFDPKGNLLIADTQNNRVRRVDARTGAIRTIAGNGRLGIGGDGGPARKANLYLPNGVAADAMGNVYVADTYSHRVRRVAAAGKTIATVAGTGTEGYSGDGGAGTAARLNLPLGVAADAAGMLYVADLNNRRVRRLDTATGTIATLAGGCGPDAGGDGGAAAGAVLYFPGDVAAGRDGSLYVADSEHLRVRRVDPAGLVTTYAGGCSFELGSDGVPATEASLALPLGVAVDARGNLFVSEAANHRVRRVDAATGIITTVAGTGERGSDGDGGPAAAAQLFFPAGVAVDAAGNLFVADSENARVRRVDAATGVITTVAGTGERGFGGDGGPATSALLDNPRFVAVDAAGNLFVADLFNNRVRRVEAATGVITTLAEGYTGGLALDGAGDLFVTNAAFHQVVRFPAGGGAPVVVAGSGELGFGGDGGPAAGARFAFPAGISVGPDGTLYVADSGNHAIRAVKGVAAAP